VHRETRGVVGACEARVGDDLIEESKLGGDAADAKFPQRAMHARYALFRGRGPGGHQQGVVRARDYGARIGGASIESHAEAGPALGRITQMSPGGDADLRLDQIDAGGALGDGVLDLNARIHLDEVERARVPICRDSTVPALR